MPTETQWLIDLEQFPALPPEEGIVSVAGYVPTGRPPEEVVAIEKAAAYGAQAVFFEVGRNGRPSTPQAFIFVTDGPADDPAFARLHQRLWSWGGVPLIYRKAAGVVQLFRCAHKPDFLGPNGTIVCKPFQTLKLATDIASAPWWNATQVRNGTLWDDPAVCNTILDPDKAAHKRLINAVRSLNNDINQKGILRKELRRKLLILSLLIAYLEERGVLLPAYFSGFLSGASKFFEVLANGDALAQLLTHLEERFNGGIFTLLQSDRESLKGNVQLARFARFIEAHEELNSQLTLWQLYSFRDLPVELISHIYQLFVSDVDTSVYTPPFLVRLMLDEVLSPERLDRLHEHNEIILDPACGSGVFLVEAYKRLVLHWRTRNNWERPTIDVLRHLITRVHGVDLEEGAIELASFSLCLALCDALEPEAIRSSIKLFPALAGKTLHHSCFFEARTSRMLGDRVGVITGNPPFTSELKTPGAQRSYDDYQNDNGQLPDKQLAYLFLHEGVKSLVAGGVLCMLQQYNFLYNQQSLQFRLNFFRTWDVREILDFISVRGLFQKGSADTKVLVVVAEAVQPPTDRKVLHATFRRTGRADAEQGFDIDYYDLHWVPRSLVLRSDAVWRANLLGGGRTLGLVQRLSEYRTLGRYATDRGWDFGEGFIEGGRGVSRGADHIIGKPLLRSSALTEEGIDEAAITKAPNKPYEGPRTKGRFTPPMLLIREHMNVPTALWTRDYLTYTQQIVGFPAQKRDIGKLRTVEAFIASNQDAIRAYLALISPRLFTQKATALQAHDIYSIPYPESGSLDLSENEKRLVADILTYFGELIRRGEDSKAMRENGTDNLVAFSNTYTRQINALYRHRPLKRLAPYSWPGLICQPYAFGPASIDWSGADELRDRIDKLLHEQRGTSLQVTRIARLYDGHFVFLLKPTRLRYWLDSVALRDADETLADLRAQGF